MKTPGKRAVSYLRWAVREKGRAIEIDGSTWIVLPDRFYNRVQSSLGFDDARMASFFNVVSESSYPGWYTGGR